MRGLLLAAIGIVLASPTAIADGLNLAGSLWQCTRASDRSQFVITFYPGGGVGGGEFEKGEVSPYIFDASRMKPGEWPSRGSRQSGASPGGFLIRASRLRGAFQILVSLLRGSPGLKPHRERSPL